MSKLEKSELLKLEMSGRTSRAWELEPSDGRRARWCVRVNWGAITRVNGASRWAWGGERLWRISLRLDEGNRDPLDVEETSAFALAIIRGYSCLRQGGPSGGNRSPKGGCAGRSGGT